MTVGCPQLIVDASLPHRGIERTICEHRGRLPDGGSRNASDEERHARGKGE
jgi:hypothetical protein